MTGSSLKRVSAILILMALGFMIALSLSATNAQLISISNQSSSIQEVSGSLAPEAIASLEQQSQRNSRYSDATVTSLMVVRIVGLYIICIGSSIALSQLLSFLNKFVSDSSHSSHSSHSNHSRSHVSNNYHYRNDSDRDHSGSGSDWRDYGGW